MSAAEASESYANPDEYIQYKLQKARRRIKFADLLTAGLLAAVLLIGYVLIFTVLDHWVVDGGFASWTRALGLGVVLLLCSVIVVRYVVVPWFKTIHPLYAARILDGSGSSLKGALVSLVDLNSGKDDVSESVRSVMEKRAAVTLSDVNVDDAIDQSWLMKLGITLFVLVVLTSLYALISPKGINLLRPLTVANAAVATQTRILKVEPGSTTIAAGETLEVSVDLGGQLPEEVLLQYTTADKTYVDEVLTLGATDSETQFQTIIIGDSDRGLRQNFTYRILAGDAVSEDFAVIVDQPPSANVVEVNYDYPGYMMMARHETADGNMAAWEGTKVQLVAEATVPVKRATLRFSDTATFDVPAEEIPLMTREQQILGEFTLELRQDRSSPKFYRIDVEDFEGRIDPQPTVYAVNIREDKAPVVKLLDPIRDLHVPANAIIPMLVQAEDPDFMLRNVKLAFDVNGTIQTPAILYDGTRTALTQKWTGTYDFRLEDLDLKPGDIVNYYATARDNKPPLGTMSPSSNLKLMITEPESEEQIQKRLEQDRQLQKQQFQEQQEAADQEQKDDGQEGSEREPGQASEESSSGGQTGEQQSSDNGTAGQNSNNRGQEEGSQNDGAPQDPSQGETGESPDPTDPNRNQEAASDSKSGEGQQPGQPGGTEPNRQNRNEDVSDPSNVSNDDNAANAPKEGTTTNATREGDPNQSSDRLNPDTGSESDSGNQRSVDDSEAMQKLLEKYRNENGGIDPPKQDAGNSAETPSDDSGEQTGSESENQQTTDGSQNDTEAEPRPSKSSSNDGDAQEADGQNQSKDPESGDEASASDQNGQSSEQPSAESEEGAANSKPQSDMNPSTSNQQTEDRQENSQDANTSGKGQTGEANQGDDPDTQQSSNQQNGENRKSQDGKSGGDSKSGGQDGKSGGDSKSGGQDGNSGGDSKSGGQDGKSGGDSKSGGQDGKSGGDSKSGGQDGKSGGDSKSGGQHGKSGGDSKSGGQDGKSGGDSKSGGQDGKSGGDSKSGGQDGKSGGDSKSGGQDGKSGGDSKSGGQDGKSGGDSKSGGQDGKSGGDSKSGGQDGKSGGDSKSGGQDGKSGGDSKSGGKSGKGESKSGASGGSQQGGGEGGESSGAATGQKGGMGGSGGAAGSPNGNGLPPAGAGGNSDGFEAEDPNVKASAEAADLVLKRLQQDLERGDVDRDLLKELGWTEDQLKQFQARMQKNLEALKSADSQTVKADQLRRRRAEELLKSLDLKGNSIGQKGSTSRDVEQQDTTSRRTKPPASYRDWMEMYQRGLSKGRPKARE